jgi:hypothetical protein
LICLLALLLNGLRRLTTAILVLIQHLDTQNGTAQARLLGCHIAKVFHIPLITLLLLVVVVEELAPEEVAVLAVTSLDLLKYQPGHQLLQL